MSNTAEACGDVYELEPQTPLERDPVGRLRIMFPEPTSTAPFEADNPYGVPLHLAFVATEEVRPAFVTFPELKGQEIRRILSTRDIRTPDERVVELLSYALYEDYEAVTVAIPSPLIPHMPANLASWVADNHKQVFGLTGKNRTASGSKIEQLLEDTEQFESAPWLSRAIQIGPMALYNLEAEAAEIAIRLILLEAANKQAAEEELGQK